MSLDRGGIERQRDGIFAKFCQSLEHHTPAIALGPAIKAIVDRRVGTVFRRAIPPSRSRLQHVDDAADDAPIIGTPGTRQPRRHMRFETAPLSVIQPKQPSAHCSSLRINSQPENHWSSIEYRP